MREPTISFCHCIKRVGVVDIRSALTSHGFKNESASNVVFFRFVFVFISFSLVQDIIFNVAKRIFVLVEVFS